MKKINKKELHEIFQDLRNQKKDAYNKLYEGYYSLVYGIVFSILKNKEDSEDVTHEIFTKIYKLDVSKLPTDNEASWLFTVSKNECFLHLRKSRPNISLEEIYEMPSSSNDIENVIDVEYYNKLISGLKEEEKMIVSLKVLSNFTFKRISQVMNIPIGTVQWKYYNAINSLKISVGSLVGAIVAFIIVIARGEFWHEREYLNRKNAIDEVRNNDESLDNEESLDNDELLNNDEQKSDLENTEMIGENTNLNEQSEQVNENDNEVEQEINSNTSSISQDIAQETEKNIEQSVTTLTETSDNNKNIVTKEGKIQIIFAAAAIVLLIISIIFFKIYQQKLKIKSSK